MTVSPVEEIKSKISIDKLISDYIPLKKAGYNFKAHCPFHKEKTPSFMVSPAKQIWHCFGCHEGGDIFTFLQKYEGMEFREALQSLAQKTGVSLGTYQPQDSSKKHVLYEINEEAEKFYKSQLQANTEVAKKTRAYLAHRKLEPETIDLWGLGLALQERDALKNHLINKKFKLNDIIEAGLLLRVEQGAIDRFRKRLLFPIRDHQGRVVAFTARTLAHIAYDEETEGGKYINSPQTTIYNKSVVLYGFDFARSSIRRSDYAIVVEGNTDVILSHQAGVKNVIAVSGTALTEQQLDYIARYTKNVMLAFDADKAGSQAVFRSMTLAWQRDLNVKVISLPEGIDPADAIAKDVEIWTKAIADSIAAIDFYVDQVLARVDLSRADHKKLAVDKLTGIISNLKSKVEQSHYIKTISARLDVPETILWSLLQNTARERPIAEQSPVASLTSVTKSLAPHELLIAMVASKSSIINTVIDEIEPEMLDESLQGLYKKMIIYYTRDQLKDFKDIVHDLSPTESQLWSRLVFQGDNFFLELSEKEQQAEVSKILHRIKREYLSRRMQELTTDIRSAEQQGDSEQLASLLSEHEALMEKRKNYLS